MKHSEEEIPDGGENTKKELEVKFKEQTTSVRLLFKSHC
jgi:hypothetical protein